MSQGIELLARAVVVLCAGSLLVLGLAVLVREATAGRPAPVDREGGPLALVNFVGILGFVALAPISAVLLLGVMRPAEDAVSGGVRIAGIVLLAAAGLLAVWGIRSIGRNMASQAEVRPDTEVVTTGAFALVRHPLYLSILLLWAGATLALLSWLLGLCLLLLAPAFVARSRAEERLLTRHFGAAYTEYAGRVPMLVPWFHGRG